MTTTPAMPEPLGWYVVNNIGMATLCKDEAEAQLLAEDCDMAYRRQAPHRAVQLVALATLQAQPAEVSDEPEQASKVVNDSCWKFIDAMPHNIPGPIWNDLKPAIYAALIHYHRAILALRPQAVPMTDGEKFEAFHTACIFQDDPVSDAFYKGIEVAERKHGITAPAGGEK